MIDTHCHLDLPAFAPDRAAVVERATRAGIIGMVVPGVRPGSWPALRLFAQTHAGAGVRHAIGIHPQAVCELGPDERADLPRRLTEAAQGAVAIGECGLDAATGAREDQVEIFRCHLQVARALDLPLIVHVLRAHDEVIRLLRTEGPVRGVLHSYSGPADLVPAYRDLGFAFSFAGPVTYPNARRPLAAARAVPDDLLLAETDAPDQTPAPFRPKRCEPAFLPSVIEGLATARGSTLAAIAALTTTNARRIFSAW